MINPRSMANLLRGPKNPLSEADRAHLTALCASGVKYKDMASAINRPIGTVATAIRKLQLQGAVDRRYSVTDWSLLDA